MDLVKAKPVIDSYSKCSKRLLIGDLKNVFCLLKMSVA